MKKIIGGIETEIRIKKVKNVSIRVKDDGDVILTVPKNKSLSDGETFFLSKIDWIKKHKRAVSEFPPRPIADGEQLYLFGKPITLKIIRADEVSRRKPTAYLSDDILFVTDNGRAEPKKIVENFLLEELKRMLDELFPKQISATGLSPSSVSIRKMSSKWGSCTPKTKRIRMSFYLVGLPRECVDYVTLHELLHIRYPDHGAGFHAALDCYMPEWKKLRKFMRENGAKMKINL